MEALAGPQRNSPVAGGVSGSARRIRRGRCRSPAGSTRNGFEPGQIDAIWALCGISLAQAKAGKHDAARVTLREATRVDKPPKTDAKESRSELASGFVRARGYEEAMKIAETLDPDVRAGIWSQVARHERLEGDRAGAEALFRRALMRGRRIPAQPAAAEDPWAAGPGARRSRGCAGRARRRGPKCQASGGGPVRARPDPCPGR